MKKKWNNIPMSRKILIIGILASFSFIIIYFISPEIGLDILKRSLGSIFGGLSLAILYYAVKYKFVLPGDVAKDVMHPNDKKLVNKNGNFTHITNEEFH